MKTCYFCKFKLDNKIEIFRSTICPSCKKDLKVCRNCRFYKPGAHWDCYETIDEQVQDKEKANFCSFFSFKQENKNMSTSSGQEARNAFDKLFGNES